eukprot:TRINITY_DN2410_c0_g1_i1.p1 TRINITY_DN2410_c0_g1~~TRINITY_DN2410_c0_g1_i1.p1  ORF type:complete len:366 (-),score=89.15 TRINITY_DN2410_c0_g1_i1:187-1284(-)
MLSVLEPIKPIQTFLYKCDSRFHTDSLKAMLDHDDRYGFAVIDGNGAYFALVHGNSQRELHRLVVSLPKKHRRGGQSSKRFARLRLEARHNFVSKVCELLLKLFIDQETNAPNVRGLVLAGHADLKNQVAEAKVLDPRLKSVILEIVDVAYGGSQGLQHAIELTEHSLKNVTLVRHKKLISKYFEEIVTDSGKAVYGARDTLMAIEMGAVETLIVWENLSLVRHVLIDKETGTKTVVCTEKDVLPREVSGGAPGAVAGHNSGTNKEKDKGKDKEPEELLENLSLNGNTAPSKFDLVESVPLVDYFVENYEAIGVKLELVQDATSEGNQFCKGFGGLGALLRFRMAMPSDEDDYEDYANSDEDPFY